jgi:hypothetical protein
LRMNAKTVSIPMCGTQSNAGACAKQVFLQPRYLKSTSIKLHFP